MAKAKKTTDAKGKSTPAKASIKTASKEKTSSAPDKSVQTKIPATGHTTANLAASVQTNSGASSTTGSPLSASTLKNFRHHPDMENFYRFVYENDLRFEALTIIDEMLQEKTLRKKIRAARSKVH